LQFSLQAASRESFGYNLALRLHTTHASLRLIVKLRLLSATYSKACHGGVLQVVKVVCVLCAGDGPTYGPFYFRTLYLHAITALDSEVHVDRVLSEGSGGKVFESGSCV
jgi:hypothetical protein